MRGLRFYRHWIACALLMPAAAGAHHSRTQYDGSETQEIQGELISVSWANPHAAFSVRVTSASGESATWHLESWGSPYVLSRMGVTQDQFVVGTEVRLAGRVSTLVPNRFLLTNMLRPDGTEVVLTTDGDAFWNGRQVGGRSQWRNQEIATASFVVTCEPQGMPTVMNWVYPFELAQRDPSTIILRSEYFDLERTIHLAPAAVPAGVAPSRLGLSIGRFEDDGRSLVVETTALNWPYYDTIGTPLTPDVKITERFTLSDDQSALTYRQTVTDPKTFMEPAVHESQHLALGETIERFVCAPDL